MPNRRKSQRKISPNEELNAGVSLLEENPLFSRLGGYLRVSGREYMGRDAAALVRSDGSILLNMDCSLTPPQWAYVIAHCKLHLARGHFDAERMPGYERINVGGGISWCVFCEKKLWNMACDIYLAKYLADMKFGSPICRDPAEAFPIDLTDERKIYYYLVGHGVSGSFREYGTAGAAPDMMGLENPLVYDSAKGQGNWYALQFTRALAYAASLEDSS